MRLVGRYWRQWINIGALSGLALAFVLLISNTVPPLDFSTPDSVTRALMVVMGGLAALLLIVLRMLYRMIFPAKRRLPTIRATNPSRPPVTFSAIPEPPRQPDDTSHGNTALSLSVPTHLPPAQPGWRSSYPDPADPYARLFPVTPDMLDPAAELDALSDTPPSGAKPAAPPAELPS